MTETEQEPAGLDRNIIRLGLVVVAGAIMALLDTTIVNVALKTLGQDLHGGLNTIQWVVTGYLLALGTVIPLTGWAIDRFGAKRVWLLSIILFVAGSALCGAAWSVGSMIAFRVLQGLGGGMLLPVGQTILARAAGPQRMGRVMSIVGIPILMAPVFGPVLGGWLVQDANWRWIFYINVPIGALALALAIWLVPADHDEGAATRLDVRGLFLLPPGLVLLIYGLSTANTNGGFGSASTIAWLTAGLVFVAAFAVHSLRRGAWSLIDVRLFGNRNFSVSAIAVSLYGTCMFGPLLLLPLYYQTVRGQGALDAGLLLAPQGLGAALIMPVSGLLADRYGAGRIVPVGVVVAALGTFAFTQVGADTSYWVLGVALLVRGMGMGASMMPIMAAAYVTLPKPAIARATSSINILVQVFGSFGAALMAVLLSRAISEKLPQTPKSGALGGVLPHSVRPLVADAFGQTFWVAVGLMAAILLPTLFLPRTGSRAADSAPATVSG